MVKTSEFDSYNAIKSKIREIVGDQFGPEVTSRPDFADIVDEVLREIEYQPNGILPDGGLTDLVGLDPTAPVTVGDTEITPAVVNYDDTLAPKRVLAAADLYYLYMHEALGVFRTVYKLQETYRAGTLRIADGEGALRLFRFDRRSVLRYSELDRKRAYRRVFGYTKVDPGVGARSNPEFHGLFRHFIAETAKFWRDKRISEVIRERATDPTYGSIAIVRRAGLDLRANVKNSSYGNVFILRIDGNQALGEAFGILNSRDILDQFGAEDAWDLIELVLWQNFARTVNASTMNRMAVTGRDVLRYLAGDAVLQTGRTDFENGLQSIAESAEEWISSEEGMRLSRPTPPPRQVFAPGAPPTGNRRAPVFAGSGGRP